MSTHTEPEAATIREQMSDLRAEMKGDVEALVSSTEDLADWRKYVRAQPWLCVGAAALAGFLIAPSRRQSQPKSKQTVAAETATKAGVASGLGGALIGSLATALANRAAAELGQYLINTLKQQQNQKTSTNAPYRHD